MSVRDEQPHTAGVGDPLLVDGAGAGAASGAPAAAAAEPTEAERSAGRARNTIIFSVATGLSRVAGLIREIFSNALYGATGAASAFTVAFAVPNLLRALFADMALSAAFVPVFTELLERGKRREALLLLSTLFWVLLGALTLLVGVAMLTAPLYMPLFVGDEVTAKLGAGGNGLTVGLSQVMLPTVLLLGLNGLFVGALNAYDHFTIPALSPLVWNVVIIVVNLALLPAFGGTGSDEAIYAQAVGILVGTVVQLLLAVPVLRRYGIRLVPKVDVHDPRLRQVLVLMVPVAISLGLINFSALFNSILASHVSDDGPRAIEAAFRLYMLPQGVFSVAIVTVLFPVLSRAVARGDHAQLRSLLGSGMAQIIVLLVPLGLLFASPAISHDIIQTLFQRGQWTEENTDSATTALIWLGISLALNGVSLLLSRTFFALQRPWANTGLALGSLAASLVVSLALYRPFGIAGIVIGTFVGNVVLVALQIRLLRRETGGPLGLLPVLRSLLQVLVASVLAVLAATAVVLIGSLSTDALGDAGPVAWILRTLYLGLGILAGGVVYVGVARHLGLSELERAGGRFVRLGARLRTLVLRIPGVRPATAFLRRPRVRSVLSATDRVLSVIATPIALLTAGATFVSRLLVGLVPDGPEAGSGPGGGGGDGGGPSGPGGPGRSGGPGRLGRSNRPGGSGEPRQPREPGEPGGPGEPGEPGEPRQPGEPGGSGGSRGGRPVRSRAPRRGGTSGPAEPTDADGPEGRTESTDEDATAPAGAPPAPGQQGPASAPAVGPTSPSDVRPPRGRRGRGGGPVPASEPTARTEDRDRPTGDAGRSSSGVGPPAGDAGRSSDGAVPSVDDVGRSSGGPGASWGDPRTNTSEPPSTSGQLPPSSGERFDEGPDLYDAAEDWPTIGQRGGETLDVPWPGVERGDDENPFDEPEWDDDVAPSRLEAYGIDRPGAPARTPEQQERAAQRDVARRLIAAREEALARMAERERRRKELEARRGGRRGRRER